MTCFVPTLFFGSSVLVAAYDVPARAKNRANSAR
jgi:hypothetical protein